MSSRNAALAGLERARVFLEALETAEPPALAYEDWLRAAWPNVGAPMDAQGVTGPLGPHGILGYDWRGRTRSGGHATTPGSFWRWGDGLITAGHVVEEMFGNAPPFAAGMPLTLRPGGLDAAIFGRDLTTPLPPAPQPGDPILVEGITGGTRQLQVTRATVWGQRPGENTWIARQDDRTPLVEKGRSGGRVCLDRPGHPAIGIAVMQSAGNVDTDGDGDLDRHLDFVPLRDVILAARRALTTADV